MSILKSLLILIAFFCIQIPSYSQPEENQSAKQKRLEYLIANDSIYEITVLLNEDIAYAKKNHLPLSLARTHETLGHIFAQIESFDTARLYFMRAYQIYDSLNKPNLKDNILTSLTRNYIDSKNYKQFDSIVPIALAHSKSLNSINYFYNLESQVRKNYFQKEYDQTLNNTDKALEELNDFSFSTEKSKREKKRLIQFFSYYRAVALINTKQEDKGYELLFNLEPTNFRIKGNEHVAPTSQLATLNYYKYRYFNERKKQLDSANKYLFKSDSLKYLAMRSYQDRLSENGDLIYKIIDTEKQLQLTTAKQKQEQAVARAFLMATVVLSLLLVASGVFFYYYYTNRKRVQNINLKLKESNRKLKIIDKERLEFFSILSHELRTPIYGINGLATLIEQEQHPEKRKNYLNALIASSNYISVLIDNVLQISRFKFENKSLHLKPTNFPHLVHKIVSSIKVSADQKGLELRTSMNNINSDEFLLIDKVVLSQILINLTYNAIRYTKEGFVSISISEQKRTDTHVNVLFEIKDSGIGIEPQNYDLIFNAFENKTFLEKNSSGSGLGLYIVKTLLKSHNADIKFSSKPKEGSVFYFDINFEIADAPYSTEDPSLQNTPLKILVVDDNTINLMVTQKNVEKIPGCTSETASNSKEAICLVKEKDFDLVLMDINMPDMDGFEATAHIRKFDPEIPILALTALNSVEVSNKAQACGMNQVITKPYDFEEFKATIRKYSYMTSTY